jgi:hypothetical protein
MWSWCHQPNASALKGGRLRALTSTFIPLKKCLCNPNSPYISKEESQLVGIHKIHQTQSNRPFNVGWLRISEACSIKCKILILKPNYYDSIGQKRRKTFAYNSDIQPIIPNNWRLFERNWPSIREILSSFQNALGHISRKTILKLLISLAKSKHSGFCILMPYGIRLQRTTFCAGSSLQK